MSQFDFGTINPNTKTGTQLASDLNDFRDALHSSHSDTAQPSYVVTGMLWADSTSANLIFSVYDGTDDVPIFQIDATNNVARIGLDADADSYFTASTDDEIDVIIGGSSVGNFDSTGWVPSSPANARTNLGLGTAATTDSTAYATAAQGALADTALQPGDSAEDQTARDLATYALLESWADQGKSAAGAINTYLDVFTDETGVDTGASSNQIYDASGDYYTGFGPLVNDGTGATYNGFGGTVANLFDQNDATTWTSNALGNLTSTALAGRVLFSFDLGAAVDVTNVEVRNAVRSGGSGGGYSWAYSADNVTWTAFGSAMTLGGGQTDDQAVTVTARYIGLAMPQTNFQSSTLSIDGVNITSETAQNITLVSETITAAAAPASIRAFADVEEIDSATENTDFTLELSRDGGTTWTAATLASISGDTAERAVYAATVDVSGQPSGTSVLWRFKTLNSKEIRLHRVALQADQALSI